MIQHVSVYENANARYLSVPSTRFNQLLGVGSEEYCRYLWSYQIAKDKWPWRAIGNRASGKKTTSLKDFYLDAARGSQCSINCFISPNEFFDWRNVKQLAALHANWLEIDINTPSGTTREQKKSLSKSDELIVVNEVLSQLEKSGTPRPTGYVLSGSGGIHIYWIYHPESAYKYNVQTWRDIATNLVGRVSGGDLWHVDVGASKDPARVLRIPGTFHGSTDRVVRFVERESQELYAFSGLAKSLGVTTKQPDGHLHVVKPNLHQKPKKTPPPQSHSKPNSGKHTIGQWWFTTYTQILAHINAVPVTEGRRDSTLFILYVALSHTTDKATAYQRVCDINRRLIGLSQDEVDRYLATAKKTHYKYSKNTLAEYLEHQLGMDTSFLFSPAKVVLTQDEIRNAQHASAIKTAKTRSDRTTKRMFDAIHDLINENVQITQTTLAAICGKSVRTVRRYWVAIQAEANRLRSIYSPPRTCPLRRIGKA